MSSYVIEYDPVNGRRIIVSPLSRRPRGYSVQQFRKKILSRLEHYQDIYKSPVLPLQDNSLIDWLSNIAIYSSQVYEALEFHKWLSQNLYDAFEAYYSALGCDDLSPIGIVLDIFSFGLLKPLELLPLLDKIMLHEVSQSDSDP